MRREHTIRRMEERVELLIGKFDYYVQAFNERGLFTGPSLYFHLKTLETLHKYSRPSEALGDESFFDYLYATLTAWGLHRMGPVAAKLVNLEEMKKSFRSQEQGLHDLEFLRITDISERSVTSIVSKLWVILHGLKVSISRTKIVANSKALHHVLPDLMPPVDRQYTLRFFYNHTTLNEADEAVFREIYPCFRRIALACKANILDHLGSGMNTSQTKVIDNAIIGFVLKELKGK